jgi:hypothetical protein
MGHAILERVLLFGTRSADIRASGHNGCIATEVTLQATTEAEYMTAPERFADSQIPLAPRAPSIHVLSLWGAAMKRRDFISVIVGATAWPLTARAQQPAMPVVGILAETRDFPPNTAVFRLGVAESGYVEGENVAFEDRFANFKLELLPQLASDLVRRKVNVIFAATPEAVVAARNAAPRHDGLSVSATGPCGDDVG